MLPSFSFTGGFSQWLVDFWVLSDHKILAVVFSLSEEIYDTTAGLKHMKEQLKKKQYCIIIIQ